MRARGTRLRSRVCSPPERENQVYLEGDAAGKTDALFAILTGKKII